MKSLILKLVIIISLVNSIEVFAQAPQGDYEGNDFWLAFMPNNGSSTMTVLITSRFATTANVSTPLIAGGLNQNVAVPANGVVQVNIPATVVGVSMVTTAINTPVNAGIRITCPAPISVFGSNVMTASSDTWLNIPANKLGTDYLSVAFTGYSTTAPALPSQVLVLATEPGSTNVNFSVPAGKQVQGKGASFSASLNQGQTYLIQAPVGISDAVELTGIKIVSDKKIGVYGGVMCSGYPQAGNRGGYASCGPCDHMVEMITPTSSWGGTYVLALFDFTGANGTASGSIDTKGNFVRIVSAESAPVTVTVSGQAPVTLNGMGDYKDRLFTQHTVITSTQKIMAYQIMGATTCYSAVPSTGVGDPCFTNIAPVEQWGTKYAFATPNGATGFTHYINIIKKSSAGIVALDGVNQTGFVNIPSTKYYVKNALTVAAGVHNLTGDSAFVVYSYGAEVAGSYCNQVSGSSLAPISVPVEFLTFTASNQGRSVKLRWTTAQEVNSNEFIIERMTGEGFEPVGKVSASGNSSSERTYYFTDKVDKSGVCYYRIKQVDLSSNYKYSTTISTDIITDDVTITTSFPAKNVVGINFHSNRQGFIKINVYDFIGRQLLTAENAVIEGVNNLSINIASLPQGLYILKVETPGNQIQSLKLLKE